MMIFRKGDSSAKEAIDRITKDGRKAQGKDK